jgi:hypothetical protein
MKGYCSDKAGKESVCGCTFEKGSECVAVSLERKGVCGSKAGNGGESVQYGWEDTESVAVSLGKKLREGQ